jgi:type I restriction enzyme, S subunit
MKAKNVVPLTEDNPIHDNDSTEGWEIKKLKDITKKVPPIKPETDPERIFGYVDISSINNETNQIFEYKKIRGGTAPSRARQSIQPNDVLFSNVRTYLRNIAMVPTDLDVQVCSTGFTVLRSNGAIIPKFLFYYTLTNQFINEVTPQQTGSQYPATTDRVVKNASIRLPPISEQRRIVAHIEALLTQVNATRDRLNRVLLIMKRFRQAVLAVACSGRLTEGWREENSIDEKGLTLLQNITENRKKGIKKITKQVRENNRYENEELIDLPATWTWTSIDQIVQNFDGQRIPITADDRKARQGIYPYYGASGIIDAIDYFIFDGEFLLIGEDGANLVMRSTPIAFQAKGKFWVNNHAHVLKTYGGILHQFLEYYINSIDLQNYVTGSAQPKLTQTNLNKIPIPLPPLSEQHEIVHRVDALFMLANQIEQKMAGATKRTEALTQAVLAKAFRGKLVTMEANRSM